MKKLLLGTAALLLGLAVPAPAHALGTFGLIPHACLFPCCGCNCCCPPYNAFTPPCCNVVIYPPGSFPTPPYPEAKKHCCFGHACDGRIANRFPPHGGGDCGGCDPCGPSGGWKLTKEGYVLDGAVLPPTANALVPQKTEPQKTEPSKAEPPKAAAPAAGAPPSGPTLPLGRPAVPQNAPGAPPLIPVQPTSYYQPAYPAYPYPYPYGYPYAPMYAPAPYYGR
jgi:hypothetical protein